LPGCINAVAANFTTFLASDSSAPAELEVELSDSVTFFIGSSDERASVEPAPTSHLRYPASAQLEL
jgi:hypothetical protein